MNQVKILILVLFAFLVAVFAVSNPQPTTLKIFNYTVISDVSTVVIVLGSILLGVLITASFGFLSQAKLKKEISGLNKQVAEYKEKEEKLQLKIRELEEQLEKNPKETSQ